MSVELKLDNEQMKSVIISAIMQELTPEKRAELIQGAVHNLLSERNSYSFKRLFEQAVEDATAEIVREQIEDPIVRKQITDLARDAMDKILNPSGSDDEVMRDKVVDRLSKALLAGFTGRGF